MKQYIRFTLLAAAVMFTACAEEDYKLYDTSQIDAVFFQYKDAKGDAADTVNYVFNYNIADSYSIELPVVLMGMPADHDRKIDIRAVADSSDMELGVHYTIENAVLPANAVSTVVTVKLLRGNDPEIRTRAKHVLLHIEDGEDLRSVGKSMFRITYSDIRPTIRPDWWSTTATMPTYSFENAQLFFEYFYKYAPQANLDIFNEMNERYGNYFVNAVRMRGPLVMYGDFLKMYVLLPLYHDHPDIGWQSVPSF
jgi:hypothetical protein